ncbi:sulfotransferase family protein [Enemella sp. A6]|uniref:sulfotransferase family protein n=1 Tax=Enemella sp. A6 TaxID=3440152 RepID=UPI003EBBA276
MTLSAQAQQLHELAIQNSGGLDDFGDVDSYSEGLHVLLDSLNTEAQLNEFGVESLYGTVVGYLIARLVAEAGFKAVPGVADIAITEPFFIVGLPRSGTTASHRLLASDPRHQALEMWLGFSPQPRPPRETWESNPAYSVFNERLNSSRTGTPQGRGLHYLRADLADECHHLTAQMFVANSFPSTANVPSYVRWLADNDYKAAMHRHKQNLQLIGSTSPEKRWVLKNPGYTGALPGIFDAYPDARVIVMHRDPVETIPSVCNVIQYFQSPTSPLESGRPLADLMLDMLGGDIDRFLAQREQFADRIVEVYYRDYVKDPIAMMRSVYERYEMDFDSTAEAAMRAEYEISISGDRAPSGSYSPADFGMTPEEIDERFADYLAAYPRLRD